MFTKVSAGFSIFRRSDNVPFDNAFYWQNCQNLMAFIEDHLQPSGVFAGLFRYGQSPFAGFDFAQFPRSTGCLRYNLAGNNNNILILQTADFTRRAFDDNFRQIVSLFDFWYGLQTQNFYFFHSLALDN